MTNKIKAGDVFAMLTVVRNAGRDNHGRYVFECQCECGNLSVVKATYLVSGRTKSCGCLKRAGHPKHGRSNTKVYYAWKAMRQRCTNANRLQWKDWGGRGITFDPRWEEFEVFLEDMGEPAPGQSLERRNNDRSYSKDNCEWATPLKQNNNRRSVVPIEFNGETRTMAEWARHLGVNLGTLNSRFLRGWPIERALTAGKHHRFGKFTPTLGATQ